MPARATVRMGLVSGTSLALALLAGSPALADDLPALQLGDPCTTETVLDPGLSCVDGLVAPTPAAADPSPAPDDSAPPVVEEPAPDPVPLPIDPPPIAVDPPPISLPPVDQGPGLPPGTGTGSTPNRPSDPSVPGGSLADNAKNDGTTGAVPAATPVAPGRSLLQAATVSTLASSDLPTLAAMRAAPLQPGSAGSPLSAYMPSPQLASLPPNAALAAVQAPLLAAGDDAAGGGGFTLAGLNSKALPGLLVVLATALVAAVGAANMRAWQERMPQWRRAYAARGRR
jgi:hypothetical protein